MKSTLEANEPSVMEPELLVFFNMETVYVLDFSNRTFSEFMHENVGIDIYQPSLRLQLYSIAQQP